MVLNNNGNGHSSQSAFLDPIQNRRFILCINRFLHTEHHSICHGPRHVYSTIFSIPRNMERYDTRSEQLAVPSYLPHGIRDAA